MTGDTRGGPDVAGLARAGAQAADALAAAFGAAGDRISLSLGEAAKSGELDFRKMAEAILRDLARVAAEALILKQAPGNSMSANFNFAPGADERGALAQSSAIAALLARMVQGGGRFL